MRTRNASHIQSFLKLLLAVVLTASVFSAAANAHPGFAGKFTLPYEVHWGKAVLPPGNYFIRMDSTIAPAIINSTSGDMTIYTEFPTVADSHNDQGYLTITTQGNEHKVRSMNLPGLGKTVIFAPLSKGERETLAKAQQITKVPVIAARK
jgi:hypothetical protein